jgi:hypothetical protein
LTKRGERRIVKSAHLNFSSKVNYGRRSKIPEGLALEIESQNEPREKPQTFFERVE